MSKRRPSPEFWRALLDIHTRLFELTMAHYNFVGRPDDHLFYSFQIIDVWLDEAIAQGWLDEKDVFVIKH